MNSISRQMPITGKVIAILGVLAVLALGAAGFSAMFAHASVGPAVTPVTTNASNAVVTSAIIGTNVIEGATVASTTTTVPTGTVTFSTFSNLTCTGTPTVQSGVALGNGMASSSQVTVTNAGLSYIVNYNGDGANVPSVSGCAIVASTSAPVIPPPVVTGASGTISGTVFNDTNNNRKLDSGEAGVAGVQIKLSVLQNNWWLSLVHMQKYVAYATTTSDVNGNYSFSNVPAGVYKVEEVKTKGVAQTGQDYQPVPLTGSQGDTGLNFANHVAATSTKMGKGHDKKDKDGNYWDGHFNFASTTASTTIHGDIDTDQGKDDNKNVVKGILQKVLHH